jgi:hypothetical protein
MARHWFCVVKLLAFLVAIRVPVVGEPAQTYRAVAQTHSDPVVFRNFASPVYRVYYLKNAIPPIPNKRCIR